VFHSPKDLRNDLEAARQRLEWQIGQIYRARNTLVHRGEQNDLLPHLVHNLRHYFSTTISRLLHGLAEKKDHTSREAALCWCAQSDYVLDRLAHQPSHPQLQCAPLAVLDAHHETSGVMGLPENFREPLHAQPGLSASYAQSLQLR
jgi:hypothetical protein